MNVLLLDDDVTMRSRLARSLARRGWCPYEAGSIGDACTLAESHALQGACIDLRLAGESGLDAVAMLRPRISGRMVMLTGFGNIPSAMEATRRGIDEYLLKPQPLERLIDALEGRSSPEHTQQSNAPTLDEFTWEYISDVLARHAGNITKAADALGIHRQSLQRMLRKGR